MSPVTARQPAITKVVVPELQLIGIKADEAAAQAIAQAKAAGRTALRIMVVVENIRRVTGGDQCYWGIFLTELFKAAPDGSALACVVAPGSREAAGWIRKGIESKSDYVVKLFASENAARDLVDTWPVKPGGSETPAAKKGSKRTVSCPHCNHKFTI